MSVPRSTGGLVQRTYKASLSLAKDLKQQGRSYLSSSKTCYCGSPFSSLDLSLQGQSEGTSEPCFSFASLC